ncbi:hypothetical protein Pfo_021112 [Paulownia fortunei]|nr:hypothetical protein Pfo_021112 [Paulownia fortunei]
MVMSEEEITRLYRIQKTMMQMLRDRDYMVGDFEIEMSKYQFLQKYSENMKREDLVINKGLRSSSSDQIYVFFPEEHKVGVKTMKTYTNRMKEEGSVCSVTCISEISTKFHLEVFQKTLLERYTVKETQLPRFQITDPIARYYGLKRGQVVKIIRPSETAGRYVTYQYVV